MRLQEAINLAYKQNPIGFFTGTDNDCVFTSYKIPRNETERNVVKSALANLGNKIPADFFDANYSETLSIEANMNRILDTYERAFGEIYEA